MVIKNEIKTRRGTASGSSEQNEKMERWESFELLKAYSGRR